MGHQNVGKPVQAVLQASLQVLVQKLGADLRWLPVPVETLTRQGVECSVFNLTGIPPDHQLLLGTDTKPLEDEAFARLKKVVVWDLRAYSTGTFEKGKDVEDAENALDRLTEEQEKLSAGLPHNFDETSQHYTAVMNRAAKNIIQSDAFPLACPKPSES